MTDRTIQLRRYMIAEGEMDAFLAWFRSTLLPARDRWGFTLEFAYAIRDSAEFVWATSLPGDAAAFRAIEAEYMASPERAAAFAGQPQRVLSMQLDFVEPLA